MGWTRWRIGIVLQQTGVDECVAEAVGAIQAATQSSVAAIGVSMLAGAEDGLSSVCDLQLGEDVGDVVAHGLGAHKEACADLGVGVALCHVVQDVPLARGEGAQRGGEAPLGRAAVETDDVPDRSC